MVKIKSKYSIICLAQYVFVWWDPRMHYYNSCNTYCFHNLKKIWNVMNINNLNHEDIRICITVFIDNQTLPSM